MRSGSFFEKFLWVKIRLVLVAVYEFEIYSPPYSNVTLFEDLSNCSCLCR
jgi:hypothetical protein